MKILVVLFILIFATDLNAQFFSKKSQFELFGMRLYDSAEQHASTSEMQNKFDHAEAKNFSDIYIENKSSNSFTGIEAVPKKSILLNKVCNSSKMFSKLSRLSFTSG